MKTRNKALLLALCAVLLVAASVMGTLAYLTDKESVTNTFTVGTVAITLDESVVNEYGVKGSGRTSQNQQYLLVPGHEYVKDPVVHFADKSEASWLFVKIENGLADVEGTNTIDAQIKANGWTALEGKAGIYYKAVEKNTSGNAVDYPVFEKFTVSGAVNGTDLDACSGAKIIITAYAIQRDGLNDASAAWSALTTQLGE